MALHVTASSSSHFALVLPGAVARGAYEAGVIDVLVEQDLKIDRIVATSSGALNGLALAAGIRAGNRREMADLLVRSWVDRGNWQGSLTISPWALIRGRGLSSHKNLLDMMRDLVKPCTTTIKHDVELRIIITPLNGILGKIGSREATTYEKVMKFANEDFDTQESLDKIFDVVSAACSFPGLFEPVPIEGLGACVDGGAVNNAPIKYALEESDVVRVIVPVPFPPVMLPGDWKNGFSLLNHLIEILINERLFRDLKEAYSINHKTLRLEKLCEDGIISPEQLHEIKKAVSMRKVEITQIRPREGLKQSPFAGFFHKEERMRLIDEGREAARRTLVQIPAENPHGVQTTT